MPATWQLAGRPAVGLGGGSRRHSTPGRLSGRLAASNREELLEQLLAARQQALDFAGEALVAERRALAAERRAAALEVKNLRTQLALQRGILNMRGSLEEIERIFRSTLSRQQQKDWGRKLLWEHLLTDPEYQPLAACFEETGWTQQDAPAQIAALYKQLRKHAHNEFQLSRQQVDIVDGVVDKQQARALDCMCRQLGLDSGIVPAMPADSTSGDSEQEG